MRSLVYGFFSVIVSLVLLAGCSADTKKALGLSKQVPDEFSIVTNNPLVVPPEFDLVNPVDVSSDRIENKQEQEAKTALTMKKENSTSSDSSGLNEKNSLFTGFAGIDYEEVSPDKEVLTVMDSKEKTSSVEKKGDEAFLARMKSDPEIRKKVTEDYEALVAENDSFAKKLLFWQDHDVEKQDLINAVVEKERLEKINSESGKIDGGISIHK